MDYLTYNHNPIAFSDKLKREDDLISAQLDNVISAAIIIYLYQNGFQGSIFHSSRRSRKILEICFYEWFRKIR